MTQAEFIYQHFIYDVTTDGGTVLSNVETIIDGFDGLYDSMTLFVPTGAGKAGSLYYPDLRSQPHYAFEERAIADGGTVADSRYNVIINDFLGASLMNPCSVGKAGVLYSALPSVAQTTANIATVSVTVSNATSKYRISDVPTLNVVRSNVGVTDNLSAEPTNYKSAYSVRYYLGAGYSATFGNAVNVSDDTTQVFTNLAQNVDYKVKASYFINGFITSNVQYEGVRSAPNYTLGVK